MDALHGLIKQHCIGLTGGIGTGKSTVARLLAARGAAVIDADALARSVTAPGTAGLQAVTAAFGQDVLNPDGSLARQRLGAVVFADPAKRRQLEAITHPLIRAALAHEVRALGLEKQPRRFFYEAALIFERGAEADFHAIWATWCPEDLQIRRVMQRDQIDRQRAESVVRSQMEARAKADRANQIIDTSGSLAAVERRIDELLALA